MLTRRSLFALPLAAVPKRKPLEDGFAADWGAALDEYELGRGSKDDAYRYERKSKLQVQRSVAR